MAHVEVSGHLFEQNRHKCGKVTGSRCRRAEHLNPTLSVFFFFFFLRWFDSGFYTGLGTLQLFAINHSLGIVNYNDVNPLVFGHRLGACCLCVCGVVCKCLLIHLHPKNSPLKISFSLNGLHAQTLPRDFRLAK